MARLNTKLDWYKALALYVEYTSDTLKGESMDKGCMEEFIPQLRDLHAIIVHHAETDEERKMCETLKFFNFN